MGSTISTERPTFTVHGRVYRILDVIGQGAAATVYRCEDQNGDQYAVKVFDFSRSYRSATTQRAQKFDKEARILKFMSRRSPHFVYLFDYEYNRHENLGYMIMELGEGSLRDQLIGLPLNDQHRGMYWKQIVAILKDLQDSNVVHADIKPDNIILVNNVLKLTDLGIAFRVATPINTVRRGKIQGTLGTSAYLSHFQYYTVDFFPIMSFSDYMGPEVFSYHTGVKSDVWSAGIILYEMTYGRPPFYGIFDQNEKAAAIASRTPIRFPPERNRYLVDCMRRCLQPNLYKRPNAHHLIAHPYTRI
ncbi:unnamed protein product [Rotaria magnacalcarata]|uniref:Protein kinase domain-containing protein n=1 Tax=Rotaria magnacalcarata TaxID=392030 RepID=A0A819TZ45_9BILA|nr:unnamed protein product [Rotaria magnacalcarata]CAF4086115.1 unnamed protein product [Rotaria magnacalcarata]